VVGERETHWRNVLRVGRFLTGTKDSASFTDSAFSVACVSPYRNCIVEADTVCKILRRRHGLAPTLSTPGSTPTGEQGRRSSSTRLLSETPQTISPIVFALEGGAGSGVMSESRRWRTGRSITGAPLPTSWWRGNALTPVRTLTPSPSIAPARDDGA